MRNGYPCGGLFRRDFLKAGAVFGLAGAMSRTAIAGQDREAGKPDRKGLAGIPGPYPGRVVEVRHQGMIRAGKRDQKAVGQALGRGLAELTGAGDATEAWRSFFEPGDVVGIKMNPVGNPLANSSTELMLEVIEGLKSAGVKTTDMFVFERYKSEFIGAKMHEGVPEGVRWGGLTAGNDPSQLEIAWPGDDPVAGYDPDVFVHMNLVHDGFDPKDERCYRSHLGRLVTRTVNKLVLLPVLKDHGSAGITGALKNMSHGLVNNVARSHSTAATNVCNQFIPEIVSHPILREKCVLQVMDGIVGVYQGGPFGNKPEWVWEANTLLLATDPVAMDRVEWDIIDGKRKQMGLAPVGAVGKLGEDADREGFDMRQPQHVVLCGNLGLGVSDRSKIDHRVVAAG
jgi:hypothetical protein